VRLECDWLDGKTGMIHASPTCSDMRGPLLALLVILHVSFSLLFSLSFSLFFSLVSLSLSLSRTRALAFYRSLILSLSRALRSVSLCVWPVPPVASTL
jgi:hypothetical protein